MTMPTTWAAEFVDVLCADDEWVRAEFEAIVAAEADSPPPTERDREVDPERPGPHSSPHNTRLATLPRSQPESGTGHWMRERSPPP
jgi:hypothetical protein